MEADGEEWSCVTEVISVRLGRIGTKDDKGSGDIDAG